MDIVDLKQLMERVLDHSVPPIHAIIRRKRTLVTLFALRRLAHDPQFILTAIYQLALMGIELGLNIGFGVTFEDFIGMELRIAAFTDTQGNRSSFYDTQFALLHVQSSASGRDGVTPVGIKRHHYPYATLFAFLISQRSPG